MLVIDGVWMPALTRKVAALYLSVSLDLSSTAKILTPRLWASTKAFAIGAEVKLYACTRISFGGGVHFADHDVRSAATGREVHGHAGGGEAGRRRELGDEGEDPQR